MKDNKLKEWNLITHKVSCILISNLTYRSKRDGLPITELRRKEVPTQKQFAASSSSLLWMTIMNTWATSCLLSARYRDLWMQENLFMPQSLNIIYISLIEWYLLRLFDRVVVRIRFMKTLRHWSAAKFS